MKTTGAPNEQVVIPTQDPYKDKPLDNLIPSQVQIETPAEVQIHGLGFRAYRV